MIPPNTAWVSTIGKPNQTAKTDFREWRRCKGTGSCSNSSAKVPSCAGAATDIGVFMKSSIKPAGVVRLGEVPGRDVDQRRTNARKNIVKKLGLIKL